VASPRFRVCEPALLEARERGPEGVAFLPELLQIASIECHMILTRILLQPTDPSDLPGRGEVDTIGEVGELEVGIDDPLDGMEVEEKEPHQHDDEEAECAGELGRDPHGSVSVRP
jgi:hypothetical protein